MNALHKKYASVFLLLVFSTSLIFGEILLPYHVAQAVYPVIDTNLAMIMSGGKLKDGIYQAADKAATWWDKTVQAIQAGYQATMVSLGISKEVADAIQEALKWAFTAFKKRLLDMMTDDIVKWIGGGGKPRFVTDWQGFLKTAADRTAGQFVTNYLGAGFLCGPFAIKLQIALAKPPTFDEAVTCTLSTITTNIDNFFTDFSQGGWKGWLTVSEVQNNIFGADLMAIDQKYDLVAKAQEAAKNEAAAGSGYLDSKVCTKRQCPNRTTNQPGPIENFSGGAAAGGWKQDELDQGDGYFCECLNWATRSPGKIAADMLSKVAGKDWDWLLQSKEYGEYIFAIADAVINRIIKEGVLALTSPAQANGPSSPDYSNIIAGVADFKDAAENGPYATQLISQEKLLKENLGKVLIEYQTNLDVLNQTRTVQGDAFNTLKNMAQDNCPLPGGTSQQNLGTQTTGNCGANTCPCETKTVETIKVTAPSFGEATFQTTTIAKYTLDNESNTCSNVVATKTTSVTLGSLSTDAELAFTNAAISKIQTQTGLIDAAVIDLANYQKTIDDYNTAYDASQTHIGSQEVNTTIATSTINAMYSAKQKAIDSTKAIISSPTNTLDKLLSEIMAASQDTATQNSDATQKRGMDMSTTGDCSFSTGYYKTLCDIKAIKSSWDSAYTSCLDYRNRDTGGGGG